jgi:hypothetical protein
MAFQERRPVTFTGDAAKMLEMLEIVKKLGDPPSARESTPAKDIGIDTESFKFERKRAARTSAYQDIEDVLGEWYNAQIENNIKVTTFEIRQEAMRIARSLGRKDFNASNGWLYRFRRIYIKGELEPPKYEEPEPIKKPSIVTIQEKSANLTEIFSKYSAENMFIVDECVLYYKRLPSASFSSPNQYCRKKSKDKIIALLCCNLSGEEKLKPLLVGPNIDYRVFKRAEHFPCKFLKKDVIQMNLSIFFDWLSEFNNYCRSKERKIAIFVKPSEFHNSSYAFSNVHVVFFPTVECFETHPMDNGVMLNFRCHFRRILCDKYKLYESFKNFKEVEMLTEPLNIVDCIFAIINAWEAVDREVIIESYKVLFKMPQNCPCGSFFPHEFIEQVRCLDDDDDENSSPTAIKALLQLQKEDTYWALNILKNAVIQLGKPVYREFLRIENAVLGKDLKPVQELLKVDHWFSHI